VTNGPILNELKVKWEKLKVILGALNNYLIDLAKTEKASFVRIEFPFKSSPENEKFIKTLGFKQAAMSVQAEKNWKLDISKDSQILLNEMRKSTRYEIKKAEKDGVVVRFSKDEKDFETFWEIFQITVKKQGFTPFPKAYLHKQFQTLAKVDKYLVAVEENKKPLSVALFAFNGETIHYLQAGSADLPQSELMFAPKLIIWKAILEAKKRGCKTFDFHGIAPTDDPKHPWYGITQFKKGFVGYEENKLGAYDYEVSQKYKFVRFIEKNRKLWSLIRK
jgi:lipid II:glycine glycyltransferase (peptidoglycan interpeptide bridge formation enzyme)